MSCLPIFLFDRCKVISWSNKELRNRNIVLIGSHSQKSFVLLIYPPLADRLLASSLSPLFPVLLLRERVISPAPFRAHIAISGHQLISLPHFGGDSFLHILVRLHKMIKVVHSYLNYS